MLVELERLIQQVAQETTLFSALSLHPAEAAEEKVLIQAETVGPVVEAETLELVTMLEEPEPQTRDTAEAHLQQQQVPMVPAVVEVPEPSAEADQVRLVATVETASLRPLLDRQLLEVAVVVEAVTTTTLAVLVAPAAVATQANSIKVEQPEQ